MMNSVRAPRAMALRPKRIDAVKPFSRSSFMMNPTCAFGVLMMAFFCAPAARADVLDQYTIAFTGNGVIPTAGSFTYDPDTATFSSFVVTWDSLSFDLTSAANTLSVAGPTPSCFAGLSAGAASFVLITQSCALPAFESASEIFWFGDTEVDHSARFVFSFPTPPPASLPSTELDGVLLTGPAAHDVGSGGWTTTQVTTPAPPPGPVPEPSSLMLISFALLPIALAARKRFGR